MIRMTTPAHTPAMRWGQKISVRSFMSVPRPDPVYLESEVRRQQERPGLPRVVPTAVVVDALDVRVVRQVRDIEAKGELRTHLVLSHGVHNLVTGQLDGI